MEPTTLVLVPSPLLGPAVWEPVAAELANRGYPVQIVPVPSSPPRTCDDVLEHLLSATPSDRDVVVVPHSNAGLYVPALADQRHVARVVFVDAGLPPRSGDVPLAPPVPSGWDTGLAGACAYLAFGNTYAEDRDVAAVRGWSTATMSGSHLHMLVDATAVTRELQALLMHIGVSAAAEDQ